MRKRPIAPAVVIAVIASAIGIALALWIDWFPVDAAEQAKPIDTLYDVLMIVSVPIFVLVVTVILYSVWAFRMRPGQENEDGPPIHGNTRLEVVWTAVPAIILVSLCSYAYAVLKDIEEIRPNTLVVNVTGEQFAWSYSYPQESGKPIASNQLYLPEDRPVLFKIRSKDVIHDFWVPAFRMKVDAVPGITTSFRVTPTRAGTYPVICAELCGLGHSVMRSTAFVVSPDRFEQWLAKQSAPPAAAGGGTGEKISGDRPRRDRQGDVRRVGRLRRLPQARGRRHHRHDRPGSRHRADGHERGRDPHGHRRPRRRRRRRLSGRHHADELRRHAFGATARRAGRVPRYRVEVMEESRR